MEIYLKVFLIIVTGFIAYRGLFDNGKLVSRKIALKRLFKPRIGYPAAMVLSIMINSTDFLIYFVLFVIVIYIEVYITDKNW